MWESRVKRWLLKLLSSRTCCPNCGLGIRKPQLLLPFLWPKLPPTEMGPDRWVPTPSLLSNLPQVHLIGEINLHLE